MRCDTNWTIREVVERHKRMIVAKHQRKESQEGEERGRTDTARRFSIPTNTTIARFRLIDASLESDHLRIP